MLIPSIDLMGGKVVQLVQGERKALEYDDLNPWIERFRLYSMVQVIDLDAAMGTGSNPAMVQQICERLPCQVGGGIRTVEAAMAALGLGAKKVIIGSALFQGARLNLEFAQQLAHAASAMRLIFAVDSRAGHVAIKGWKEATKLTPQAMMRETSAFCAAFLYTHIDTEGTMNGFPFAVLEKLRAATERKLIVAGGIKSQEEVDKLHALGIDAVVGMAVYTGALKA